MASFATYYQNEAVHKEDSILAVQDSICALKLIHSILERAGYQNRSQASTLDEVLLALQAKPQAILLHPRIPERAEVAYYMPPYALAGRIIIEAVGLQQRLQTLGKVAVIGMSGGDLANFGITEEWVEQAAPDVYYTDLGLRDIGRLASLLDAIDLEGDVSH